MLPAPELIIVTNGDGMEYIINLIAVSPSSFVGNIIMLLCLKSVPPTLNACSAYVLNRGPVF